jgi:hypothetical protein
MEIEVSKMDKIEELMRKEIEQLENWIKENQAEYKQLRKDYDRKRKAYNNWSKPVVKPRIRDRKIEIKKIVRSVETPEQPQEEKTEEQSSLG